MLLFWCGTTKVMWFIMLSWYTSCLFVRVGVLHITAVRGSFWRYSKHQNFYSVCFFLVFLVSEIHHPLQKAVKYFLFCFIFLPSLYRLPRKYFSFYQKFSFGDKKPWVANLVFRKPGSQWRVIRIVCLSCNGRSNVVMSLCGSGEVERGSGDTQTLSSITGNYSTLTPEHARNE